MSDQQSEQMEGGITMKNRKWSSFAAISSMVIGACVITASVPAGSVSVEEQGDQCTVTFCNQTVCRVNCGDDGGVCECSADVDEGVVIGVCRCCGHGESGIGVIDIEDDGPN